MRYQLVIVLPHKTAPVLIFLHVSAAVSLEDTEPVSVWGSCQQDALCDRARAAPRIRGAEVLSAGLNRNGGGLRAMSSAWDFSLGRETWM